MKLSNHGDVPVYTIAGTDTARPLPEWLARKRKRSLKKDVEYANRVELLQDFEYEEASQCVRVSEDGEWAMSTGTYKPQIHTHYLPHLSLSYARHTNTVNQTFVLLSSDYSKSLHLQTDRFLEFHAPGGLHYTTRVPRYGRDLKYNRRTAEALVPAVGVNAAGSGEVFRLNLELGRFMKGYEVEVGGDDLDSFGSGALQGGLNTGSVNCAALADESHGLMAFGTSLGTVEFWDSRSRNRASILESRMSSFDSETEGRSEITALTFHHSGLNLVTGNSKGLVQIYDLRSPLPLLEKRQGYDYPIQTLSYLESPLSSSKILSADRKGIKIWEASSGSYWTGVEPTVDLNHVEWVAGSGMLLTANEGRQQHAFFIPQLGPAPKWCAFLDNLVEEMAEDADDPNAFRSSSTGVGEVYDNYKFLDMKQMRDMNLDPLIGTTSLLRPYMHGYFVGQKLYEQARLITNPDLATQQRQKSIQEKIEKERESRIRGNKKVAVKVNRKLAEKLAAQEEAHERKKVQRLLRKSSDALLANGDAVDRFQEVASETRPLVDDRFRNIFENEDFEIDETSREFALQNPSSVPTWDVMKRNSNTRGLTAVEEEEIGKATKQSSSVLETDDDEESQESEAQARQRPMRRSDLENEPSVGRIGSTSYKNNGRKLQQGRRKPGPTMRVVSNTDQGTSRSQKQRDRSFGDLASLLPSRQRSSRAGGERAVGTKEISFVPSKPSKKQTSQNERSDGGLDDERKVGRGKERRSASGNVFRRM